MHRPGWAWPVWALGAALAPARIYMFLPAFCFCIFHVSAFWIQLTNSFKEYNPTEAK